VGHRLRLYRAQCRHGELRRKSPYRTLCLSCLSTARWCTLCWLAWRYFCIEIRTRFRRVLGSNEWHSLCAYYGGLQATWGSGLFFSSLTQNAACADGPDGTGTLTHAHTRHSHIYTQHTSGVCLEIIRSPCRISTVDAHTIRMRSHVGSSTWITG
jgi:hypothetical protein